MTDTVNAGDRSDRVLAVWDLHQPAPERAPVPTGPLLLEDRDGRPVILDVVPTAGVVIAIPQDYETVRSTDPTLSLEWRMAVRQVLLSSYEAGLQIASVTSAGYVLADAADE